MNGKEMAVVKVGGKEIAPGPSIGRFARWTSDQVRAGRRIVVVHGGGEEVTERAAALGLPTEKQGGQRITSAPMLEVVLEVLAGRVNARLVAALNGAGIPAVGLSGISGRLLSVSLAGDPPGSLGYVGTPSLVRPALLRTLLDDGFTPVLAPLGVGPSGQPMNVNADLAAGAIARALQADLYLVTDVPGVRDASGRTLRSLTAAEARRLVAGGAARDGMVPKLEAAESARSTGSEVWIGDLEGLEGRARSRGTRVLASHRPMVRTPLARRAAELAHRGRAA